MGDQALLPGAYDPRFDEERLRDLERDFTPQPIVRQFFDVLHDCPRFQRCQPGRILDPAAGAGVFAVVAHETWPTAIVDSVEIAEEEDQHLQGLASHRAGFHFTTSFQQFAASLTGRNVRYDLISTNPAFSQAIDYIDLGRKLLTPDGMLALLLPTRSFQKTADGIDWLMRTAECSIDDGLVAWPNLPDEEIRFSGTIAFRGGSESSWDTYSWFIWGPRARLLPRGDLPSWDHSQLPLLPGAARRWTTRPGEVT